ncbi:mid1-interacting protein 1 [Ischnura elegans]|uniref:mid1-interacting protein 1 n=1 Tax=Ischnura elegans TaxID=197161 RepID=UPI001ED88857|nr:mid1-interacting protein 1 [Ischnura elegans]
MLTSDFTMFSDSITSTMDSNSRNCIRGIARGDEKEFSNQSILNTMKCFVRAVNEMDETILVPCRLMDMKLSDGATEPPMKNNSSSRHRFRRQTFAEDLAGSDLYSIYTMVNAVREELLWGSDLSEVAEDEEGSGGVRAPPTTPKGHVRRPSSTSVASCGSASSTVSSSDTDSETGNEDSGVEGTGGEEEESGARHRRMADTFRRHLRGLRHSLEQMTDAATYLTTRYQNDIGGAV